MTYQSMLELLKSICLLSALLLAGAWLRARVPLFRKLFLPASVIGGFIGLLLGPRILGNFTLLPVSEEWLDAWTALPSILVIPIFAATPLGMFSSKNRKAKSPSAAGSAVQQTGNKSKAKPVKKGMIALAAFFATGAVIKVVTSLQEVVGLGTNVIYSAVRPDSGLYKTFGYELARGFAGGHGSAGMVGSLLQGYGFDYWETAQGVTTTTATIGLIAGMIIGIITINVASRKGYTAILKKPSEIPEAMSRGYESDIGRQESIGRETMMSSSIDTITIHLAVLLLACGIGFIVQGIVDPGDNLPVWFFCMAGMYPVDWAISKLGLGWLIDTKVKARIIGSMSDFAIAAAIASIPVKTLSDYAGPLFAMVIAGLAVTFVSTFIIFKWLFPTRHPFEHSIMMWGLETGVLINGMMLLKICDPEYETTALNDVSLGMSLFNLISLPLTLIIYYSLKNGTRMQIFLTVTAVLIVSVILLLLFRGLYKRSEKMQDAPEGQTGIVCKNANAAV